MATGSALEVKNASGGPALGLQVGAWEAPLTVNPETGTATGLSADEIDGRDSGELGQIWAVVNHTNSTCALVRGSGATRTSSSNFCGVRFDHDISDCACIAGLSEPASGYPGVDRAGEAWAFVGDGAPDTVYVRTANSSGAKTALPRSTSPYSAEPDERGPGRR